MAWVNIKVYTKHPDHVQGQVSILVFVDDDKTPIGNVTARFIVRHNPLRIHWEYLSLLQSASILLTRRSFYPRGYIPNRISLTIVEQVHNVLKGLSSVSMIFLQSEYPYLRHEYLSL